MRWMISHFFPQVQRAGFCMWCVCVFCLLLLCASLHPFQQFAFLSDTSVTFWVWWVTVIVSAMSLPSLSLLLRSKSGMLWIFTLRNVSTTRCPILKIARLRLLPSLVVCALLRSEIVTVECSGIFEHLRTGFMFLFQFRFLLHFIFLEFMWLPRTWARCFWLFMHFSCRSRCREWSINTHSQPPLPRTWMQKNYIYFFNIFLWSTVVWLGPLFMPFFACACNDRKNRRRKTNRERFWRSHLSVAH